jgi:hypothetical protein
MTVILCKNVENKFIIFNLAKIYTSNAEVFLKADFVSTLFKSTGILEK